MSTIDKLVEAIEIEEGLLIPEMRKEGLKSKDSGTILSSVSWLIRNFPIKNGNHPEFEKIFSLIKQAFREIQKK